MGLERRVWVACGLVLTAVAGFVACVGDDPTTSTDSGGSDASTGGQETSSPGSEGGGPSSDASPDGGACADLDNDPKNCGACGHSCTGEHGCFKGVCGNIPVLVRGGPGSSHVCALLANGTVWCWGANDLGQLGIGDETDTNRDVPTRITKDVLGNVFDKVVDVTLGTNHTCALKQDKSIWCWGSNARREVGALNSTEKLRSPGQIALVNAQLVRAGGERTCAIDGSGGVQCWGSNVDGALGHAPGSSPNDNSCAPSTTPCNGVPTPVIGLAGTKDLALGESHACALHGTAGNVRCWGSNGNYQLGDMGTARSTPTVVSGLPLSTAIFAGYHLGCALDGTGVLRCWGGNSSGEMAIGNAAPQATPIAWGTADGGTSPAATNAGAGVESMVVNTKTGGVLCAGFNAAGECGDGTLVGSDQFSIMHHHPVAVVGPDGGAPLLSDVVQVTASGIVNCALTKKGEIYCWGRGEKGQLGDGTITNMQPRPVRVSGLPLP